MSESTYQTVQLRVRYSETDQMSVVYHGNYFSWFEVGRTHYLREAGFSYRELEQQGVLLPLTDATASFKQPARYDDLVEIRTVVREVTPLRLEFGYEVLRVEDGQLLVSGVTKHVFTNRELKPLRLSRMMPDLYRWLEGKQEGSQHSK